MKMEMIIRSSISLIIISTLIISSSSQSQNNNADSCTSNPPLFGLSGFPFDPSSLTHCLSAWPSRSYFLRYTQASSNVWSFLLSAPDVNSYVAVGFSSDGQMVGSSALVGWIGSVGNVGQVKEYYLGGQTPGQVVPDQGNLMMIGSSMIVSRQSILYMAFQLNTTSQPSNMLLYALGPTGRFPTAPAYALTQHRDKVSTTLNYVTGESNNEERPYTRLRRSHGILNILGWGTLTLIGAIVARYYKDMEPIWFYIHVMVQCSGFVLGVIGVIAGLVLEGNLGANINVSTHKVIGISILILGCLQVMAVLIRPEKSSKYRRGWKFYHLMVGRIVIAIAIGNVFYGIQLGGEGSGWNGGYGVVLVVIFVIILILELRMRLN
ncbi:Cytochrome b561 and DOMON domain-containing protein At3g07570 [Linum perenne]